MNVNLESTFNQQDDSPVIAYQIKPREGLHKESGIQDFRHISPNNYARTPSNFDLLTLEQVLNDGRLSVGRDSKFKNSFARQRIIDLDLNSIEFNTPPPEQESALFNEF
jgi:hypothetical protein